MMNQKWRIIIGICLMMMVCVPLVSAVIQIPTTKHSYSRPSLEQLKVAKDTPYTFENNRISDGIPSLHLSDSSGDTWRADFSVLVTGMPNPEITDSFLSGLWAPSIRRPGTISSSDIYITEEEAITIALAQYPNIILTEPITATLEQIDAADNPQAKTPCWVVEIVGFDGPMSEEFTLQPVRGGITYIDAVTGDILYRAIAIGHFEEMEFAL